MRVETSLTTRDILDLHGTESDGNLGPKRLYCILYPDRKTQGNAEGSRMATASSQISLRIPTRLLKRLDSLAREEGSDRSALVREAIRQYLEGPTREAGNRPYARVRDLVGGLSGGPTDLGSRHREYLKRRLDGG